AACTSSSRSSSGWRPRRRACAPPRGSRPPTRTSDSPSPNATPMAADPSTLDIVEAGHQLRAKTLTAEALTEACLANVAARNDELRAFITVTAEAARAAARLADRELDLGHDRGPLHGIPIALKDLIDQAGVPTTAASHVRPLTPASGDAIVTAR